MSPKKLLLGTLFFLCSAQIIAGKKYPASLRAYLLKHSDERRKSRVKHNSDTNSIITTQSVALILSINLVSAQLAEGNNELRRYNGAT